MQVPQIFLPYSTQKDFSVQIFPVQMKKKDITVLLLGIITHAQRWNYVHQYLVIKNTQHIKIGTHFKIRSLKGKWINGN